MDLILQVWRQSEIEAYKKDKNVRGEFIKHGILWPHHKDGSPIFRDVNEDGQVNSDAVT